MSDLRDYGLAVERDVVPPDLADLVEVAQRRRRQRLVALGALATVVVVAGALAGVGGWVAPERGAPPAHRGSGPTAPLPPSAWTAEDIVGHPDAVVLYSIDAADPAHRLASVPASDHDGRVTVWFRCSTGDSTPYVSDCLGERAGAIEVSGGRGAPLLVEIEDEFMAYSLEYVGGGRFFVNGAPPARPDALLGAGMTEPLWLTVSPDPAPVAPGQDLLLCSALPPCTIDLDTATLTPVAVPGLADYDFGLWADSTEIGLWGIAAKGDEEPALVLQDRPTGTLREVPIVGAPPMVLPIDVPAGVMAYFTNEDCCLPAFHNMPILRLLHVSTDQGKTWRVLAVPDGIEGSLDQERYVTHLPTLPEGWEDWPEADDG